MPRPRGKATLAAALALALLARTAANDAPFTIGVIGPFIWNAFHPALKAIAMFEKDWVSPNPSIDIGRRDFPIRILDVRDSLFAPDEAMRHALDYINSGIDCLVGPSISSCSISVGSLTMATKTLQVSPASSASDLSDKQRFGYFSRMVGTNNGQGVMFAEALHFLEIPEACLVYSDNGYGASLREGLLSRAVTHSLTITEVKRPYQTTAYNATIDASAIAQVKSKPLRTILQAFAQELASESYFHYCESGIRPPSYLLIPAISFRQAFIAGWEATPDGSTLPPMNLVFTVGGFAPLVTPPPQYEALIDNFQESDLNANWTAVQSLGTATIAGAARNAFLDLTFMAAYACAGSWSRMLDRGATPSQIRASANRSTWLQELRKVEFRGVDQGWKAFDANGDQETDWTLNQLRITAGSGPSLTTWPRVLWYNLTTKTHDRLIPLAELTFPNGVQGLAGAREYRRVECTAGKEVSGLFCVECSPGRYAPAGAGVCYPCEPGQYAPGNGSHTCVSCEAGRSSSTAGSSACAPCGAGSYSLAGASACEPCSPGSYAANASSEACDPCSAGFAANSSGAAACQPCAPGSFAAVAGQRLCTPCPLGEFAHGSQSADCSVAELGAFAEATGMTAVDLCPGGMTTAVRGTTSGGGCVCKSSSYHPCSGEACTVGTGNPLAEGFCRPCPDGMTCQGPDENLHAFVARAGPAGYKHLPPAVASGTMAIGDKAYSCVGDGSACPGGNMVSPIGEMCAHGGFGVACAECPTGSMFDGSRCRECSTNQMLGVAAFFVVAAGLCAVMLASAKPKEPNGEFTMRSVNAILHSSVQGMTLSNVFYVLQCMTVLKKMNIEWPQVTDASIDEGGSVFDFEMFKIPCMSATQTSREFAVTRTVLVNLLPVFLMIIFGAFFLMGRAWRPERGLVRKVWPDKDYSANGFLAYYSTLFMTIANSAINTAFATFIHPSKESSLSFYPFLLESDSEVAVIRAISVAGILLWCAGGFAMYIYLLLQLPKHAGSRSFRIATLPITVRFRRGAPWWFLVVLARSLLTALSLSVSQDGGAQLLWLIVVTVLYLCALLSVKPYYCGLCHCADVSVQLGMATVLSSTLAFAASGGNAWLPSAALYATVALGLVHLGIGVWVLLKFQLLKQPTDIEVLLADPLGHPRGLMPTSEPLKTLATDAKPEEAEPAPPQRDTIQV